MVENMKFNKEEQRCPTCDGRLGRISEEDGVITFACFNDFCPVDKVTISGDVN
jgi:uncharacterized protein with PIN domain